MSISAKLKSLSICAGLYRQARWLRRCLQPAHRQRHLGYIQLYRSLLPTGALCFDIGANIGEISDALLSAGARVVAFEPNPSVHPELRARCNHAEGWALVTAAVGNEPGITELFERGGQNAEQSGLDPDWGSEIIATHYVPVVTLDSAIRRFGIPFYCKIDVEGWELEVLKGLTHKIPLISLEFHLNEMNISKTSSCLERLLAFGPSNVNVTPAEGASFHLPDWMPIQDFLAWFPGDMHRSLPGDTYGDIWIKSLI